MVMATSSVGRAIPQEGHEPARRVLQIDGV
jgi:hypothetical protein